MLILYEILKNLIMSTTTLTFDLDESIANAYLLLLRQQSKKVKLLLLKGLQKDLDSSVEKGKTSSESKHSIMGMRGILSNELTDEEARQMYSKEKYGI